MDSAKTIVCDCDGVLTDGKLYIDHTGEKMFKAFHSRDVRAIRELVANGYRFIIVTADDSAINKSFAEKTGAEFFYTRDKSNLPFKNYIAIGDDAWDLPMLKKATVPMCPANAMDVVRDIDDITILSSNGGDGVIAEAITIILCLNKLIDRLK